MRAPYLMAHGSASADPALKKWKTTVGVIEHQTRTLVAKDSSLDEL